MKNSATSGLVTEPRALPSRKVWTNVSRYLFWTVRRWTSSRPCIGQARVHDVRAAVHDHLVTARGQARGELLDGRLEATVGSGNPSCAKDREIFIASARE